MVTAADAIQHRRLRGKTYNRCKGPVGGPPVRVSMDEVRRVVPRQAGRIKRVSGWREEEG